MRIAQVHTNEAFEALSASLFYNLPSMRTFVYFPIDKEHLF